MNVNDVKKIMNRPTLLSEAIQEIDELITQMAKNGRTYIDVYSPRWKQVQNEIINHYKMNGFYVWQSGGSIAAPPKLVIDWR